VQQKLELSEIFDESNMDDRTLHFLHEAAANADIARALNRPPILPFLLTLANDLSASTATRKTASALLLRIHGWEILEDAFFNTQADFARAASFLKDAASSAVSLGIILDSLINHPDLVSKLSESSTVWAITHGVSPPRLWADAVSQAVPISHDEFLIFLRAFIGIGCTVVTWFWADILPNRACRDRSLSIIRLWQDVPGYREVRFVFLSRLLLL
jgi:hypothetical protein